MWAKISSALKPGRPGTPTLDQDDELPPHADVLSKVYEQHPNLSVFHQASEIPFPSPSPPASPSKHGRRGMFKRPKAPRNDTGEPTTSSPVMLPLHLPKKVKSSLHLSNGSDVSLSRPSLESTERQSQGLIHPAEDMPPITPTTENKFGSLRSILRDRNTPATGQSVRFFSRDAYKVITPDVSSTSSSEPEAMSFAARLQRATPARPAAQDLFSPPATPATPSLMMPMPPPNVSNIFDLSQDGELPTIPAGIEAPLLDSAIEISDADANTMIHKDESCPPTPPAKPSLHDRSHSFSFGQTIFRSLGSESSPASISKANRSRALSDTVFHSFAHTSMQALSDPAPPEADINDKSAAIVAYASPEREKDPFGANATTYYTPGTMMPPTPPHQPPEGHVRKASKEEDLIWSLRTQLALQSELCVQFEVDLGARDELVQVLTARLEESERECERRKGVIRSWRKRVAELERCVRGLQEEVDRSREESMERSVMDEASGEALRMLHRRIEALEHEKAESDKREIQAREDIRLRDEELERVRGELSRRDQSERELKEGIKAAREQMEQMGDLSGAQEAACHDDLTRQVRMHEEAERQHAAAEVSWTDERVNLLHINESLRNEQASLQSQLTNAREELSHKESEIGVLKAELEAQWRHTEKSAETIQDLQCERKTLRDEVDVLMKRMSGMEENSSQTENKRLELEREIQEVWVIKEDAEHARDEIEDQLRSEHEHAEHLTQALQEREDRATALEQERQYAVDTVSRLEARIRQRDADCGELSERMVACEKEAEMAQEEMAKMKREHARIVNEQSRTLQEVVAREVETRAVMENLVREKAESDVLLGTLKERLGALQEETERLRRQVYALQQESADKEVKLANFVKQRAQDKEDLQGLNIALDSKQQELELLKRRIGVRGTAGSTPAQVSKAPHRRESSIFATPTISGSRPPSALSDAGSTVKERKLSDPPLSVAKPAFAKSVRTNGSAPTAIITKRSVEGSMGPPPAVSRSAVKTGTQSTATPTRIPSSLTPRPGVPGAFGRSTSSTSQRRTSSASILEPSRLRSSLASRETLASASETDEKEKENTAPGAKSVRRMSAMLA
ncbi:hypothetical protein AcV7_001791 [Taiwanofungus camphoratus]|nr:hypothetical protein AcV7_001791 [Antrodia cinnamomea]